MKIRYAAQTDSGFLVMQDKHIEKDCLIAAIAQQRVVVIEEQKNYIGWLRFSYFWDAIPFLDMLYILEAFRNQSYGTQLMDFFESQMRLQGMKHIMTSTSNEEYAQHFYHKRAYKTIGGFFPVGDPYEILLRKELEIAK